MYRPPSLRTLLALECAARLRSYSRAAEELSVTHSAISHRIREVEARLGVQMFDRQGNEMVPTAAARQILPVIRQAMQLINSVFPAPVEESARVLRVGVLSSFAAHWLVPRLQAFHLAHPEILISLDARLELSNVGPNGLDAAIRYGQGDYPGLVSDRLISDPLYPACSPEYQARLGITSVEDLKRCRLLRNSWQPWTPWFQMVGLQLPEPSDSVPYDDSGLLLDAVTAGHGVGLVRTILASDALEKGEIVRLSPLDFPFTGAYHYAYRHDHPKRELIQIFGAWLHAALHDEFDAVR